MKLSKNIKLDACLMGSTVGCILSGHKRKSVSESIETKLCDHFFFLLEVDMLWPVKSACADCGSTV